MTSYASRLFAQDVSSLRLPAPGEGLASLKRASISRNVPTEEILRIKAMYKTGFFEGDRCTGWEYLRY